MQADFGEKNSVQEKQTKAHNSLEFQWAVDAAKLPLALPLTRQRGSFPFWRPERHECSRNALM